MLGYYMGPKQDTDLVATALENVRFLRGELPEQVVLHPYRGIQFASNQLYEFAITTGV